MSTPSAKAGITVHSSSEKETLAIGALIGAHLGGGDLAALTGGLGTGKTRLIKGIASGLGVADADVVTSPTYKLLNVYRTGGVRIFHVDAFRLVFSGEVDDLFIEEARAGGGVVLIEWADRIAGLVSEPSLAIEMCITGGKKRSIRITAPCGKYEKLFDKLKKRCKTTSK